jgi:RNA polymerase sigma-70 factor (family 1)
MIKHDFQTESDLISGLREGNESAFSQIFKKYWYQLYAAAYAKLQSHEVAEEIVQDLLVTLWEKRNVLLITNLSHYLHTSLKNKCIDLIRKKITQEKYFAHCKASFSSVHTNEEDAAELTTVIEKGISVLPEKTRDIFILNRIEGLPNSEIAKRHNLTEKSVEYHITKSIKQLRQYIREYLLTLTAIVSNFF